MLMNYLQDNLVLQKEWFINGQNFAKTALAWLHNHDQQHKAIMALMQVSKSHLISTAGVLHA